MEAFGPESSFKRSSYSPGCSSLRVLPSCFSMFPFSEGLTEHLLQPPERPALTLWLDQLCYFSVPQSVCVLPLTHFCLILCVCVGFSPLLAFWNMDCNLAPSTVLEYCGVFF